MDKRDKYVDIFKDTCLAVSESERLQQSIKYSVKNQRLYLQGETYTYENLSKQSIKQVRIIVSGKRTFEAAESYAKSGKKVAVLNFASAKNPGGGVKNGAYAQEECLCRCSTLYYCLNTDMMWEKFYEPHRAENNPFYNDDIICTPAVTVFKSDIVFPERLPESEWYNVDVLTCAAPNLRSMVSDDIYSCFDNRQLNMDKDKYRLVMKSRIRQLFIVAQTTGADVLILGAFGCGAFKNPPEVVAQLFKEAVDEFGSFFEVIEFAVYHSEKSTRNFEAFSEVFGF